MIHTGVLREAENASVGPNVNKLSASAQKPRLKAKALGDVKNTLHSKFVNPITGSEVKAPSKSSLYSKSATSEKVPSGKGTASERKINVTPTKSARKIATFSPPFENEIHNHILCEQDSQFYLNDFFKEYKFSEEQINQLTYSVKSFVTPFSVESYEPCDDIEIPDVKKSNENSFSINDIYNDIITIPVPPPVELF